MSPFKTQGKKVMMVQLRKKIPKIQYTDLEAKKKKGVGHAWGAK